MDFKRVLRVREKLTRQTKSRRNAKDTDSGISSASSCDTTDVELSPYVTANIKIGGIAEIKSNALSPIVVLERSKMAERLFEQTKHLYLQALELSVPSDVKPIKTESGNETGKDLIYSENFREPHITDAVSSVNSSSTMVKVKYNLRKSDKCNVPKRFQEFLPPEKKSNAKPACSGHPLLKSKPVHNITIVKHLSVETSEKSIVRFVPFVADQQTTTKNKIIKSKKQRRKTNKVNQKTKTKANMHRGKLWKRSNDVPPDVECITSDHKIFLGAVLGEFPYKLLSYSKINVQKMSTGSNSKKVTLKRETPERVLPESISERTPEKRDNPTTTLSPSLIKITFSTNLDDRKVKEINFSTKLAQIPGPEFTPKEDNRSVQDTFQSVAQNKIDTTTNLKTDITKNDDTIGINRNNTVTQDSESQEVPEPCRYTFNKLGSRLTRFNLTKLRENVDKPTNDNCRTRKRNSSLSNEDSIKRIKAAHDIRDSDAPKEISCVTVLPKKSLNTSTVHVKDNIFPKPVPVKIIDEGKSEMSKEVSPSSNKLLHVKPLISITDETTFKALEKYPAQKCTLPPKQLFKPAKSVGNNFQAAPIQVPNNDDLRQRLNRQRGIFKTPLLPLAKRPPTRITPEIVSKWRRSMPVMPQIHDNQDFDAISLFAESIYEVGNPEKNKSLNEPPKISNDEDRSPEADAVLYPEEEKEYQESRKPDIPASEEVDAKCNGSRAKSLSSLDVPAVELPEVVAKCTVESVKSALSHKSYSEHVQFIENCKPAARSIQEAESSVPESPSSETTSVSKDASKVFEWIESSASNETLFISDEALDSYLRKYCTHYNRRGKCKYAKYKGKCVFYHGPTSQFKNIIMNLTSKQFSYCYDFVVKLPYLFTKVFHVLVDYRKDQEKALLDMVKDITHVTNLEKKPYVILIIAALKNLGFFFHSAVKEILIVHNKEWLVEILLDIVVNNGECLENHWSLVQKLMDSLRHKPDHGITSDIFNKCINTYPPNKEFCKNVYVDLIATDRLNLSHEPENKIIKYINLLRSFCLCEYARHIQTRCNIHSNEELIMERSYNGGDDDGEEEEEPVNASDIKEPIFSSTCNDMDPDPDHLNVGNESVSRVHEQTNSCMNYFNGAHINNAMNGNSYEPYVPAIHEQNVIEYVPTQPSIVFNTRSQNCSYGVEGLVRRSSEEETNTENTNNSLVGSAKNLTNSVSSRTPSIKAFQHWASNGSTSSSDRVTENTLSDISNDDVKKLCEALKQANMSMILSLFVKYSLPNLSKSFVIHLIVALKGFHNPEQVEFIIKNIFSNFESLYKTMSLDVTHLLQLFGLNVLTYLDSHKKYDVANMILKKFPNNYSDFITTECIEHFEYLSTSNFRYLFIFKILTRSGEFREALKFLKSLDLGVNNLFADENPPKYLEYKKRLICEFMDEALKKNIPAVIDMLYFLKLEVKSCSCIDFEKYLNLLIINMLNHYSKHKSELTGILQIILSSWYKYLWKDVLRALFIMLYNELPDWKILELYQINVRSKVYETPEGNTNSITIPSNLLNEEIYILLHSYFHNLSKSNYPVKNIIIDITPVIQEESENLSITILINSRTNNVGMKSRILNILKRLPYPPAKYSESEQCILLAAEDIRSLLDNYRSERLPPLLKTF